MFSPYLNDINIDLLRQVDIHEMDIPNQIPNQIPLMSASNNWAASPFRTDTNRSLSASDPHLNILQLPSIWYESIGYLPGNSGYLSGNYVYGITIAGSVRSKNG